jgi:hypothetical protein
VVSEIDRDRFGPSTMTGEGGSGRKGVWVGQVSRMGGGPSGPPFPFILSNCCPDAARRSAPVMDAGGSTPVARIRLPAAYPSPSAGSSPPTHSMFAVGEAGRGAAAAMDQSTWQAS